MATYPPPNSDFAIFDRDAFTNEIPNNIESLSNYFLRYPLAQGGETLVNTNVTGDLTVNSPNSVVIDSVGTVALGGTTATNISIGNSTSNTTLYGQTTYIDVTNLNVKDPNILVNKNGISPLNAGLQVESGGSIVSSLLNDTAGNWIVNSTNNKIYVDNISEKTIGNDVNFNSGVSMNGQTLDMTNGEIHNCPLIYSQNNSNLTIDAKGTGNILLQTNDITRVLINNSSMAVTGSLSTTSDILAQGLNSLRYNMSNGRLGIGNTSPQYTLDVSGTSRVTGQALFTSSTNSTSSTTGAVVVTGGLGIGGNTVSGGTLALGSILPTENVKLMISSTTVDSSCNGTTSGTSINMMSMNNGARNFTFGCDGSNNKEFYLGTSGGATNDPDYFTYWDTTGRFMVYPTASGPITAPISTDIFTARGSARIDNNLYVGGSVNTIVGVGMGNDNSTVGGVISTTDNFVSGVFTAIDYSVGSGFLPRNNIPRKIIFNMSKQLTQGVATNILTLTHTASATSDDTFSISFNGFIQATTTGDNSSRAVNFLAVGVRANATAGVFVPNLTIGNSVDAHTTFASLMIGASTYSWPTLGPTTTTLALSQAMIIGTASQSLFITGEWTITQSTQTGGTFITGIA